MLPRGLSRTRVLAVQVAVSGEGAGDVAATIVGFWLSYSGLHDFAVRSGLSGPEAWAWPASVDLFITAGEAGVTISALRRRRDPAAWAYLAIGFAASVTAKVLHVEPGVLHWSRYAVAATPPCAAMLALAALLRHVYRIAVERHLTGQPAPARPVTDRTPLTATTPSTVRPPRRIADRTPRRTARRTPATDTTAAVRAALASHPDVTTVELATMTGLSDRTVRRARTRLNGAST